MDTPRTASVVDGNASFVDGSSRSEVQKSNVCDEVDAMKRRCNANEAGTTSDRRGLSF